MSWNEHAYFFYLLAVGSEAMGEFWGAGRGYTEEVEINVSKIDANKRRKQIK